MRPDRRAAGERVRGTRLAERGLEAFLGGQRRQFIEPSFDRAGKAEPGGREGAVRRCAGVIKPLDGVAACRGDGDALRRHGLLYRVKPSRIGRAIAQEP